MILYGSTTSPFVRRTRIFTQAIPLEFKAMDIFSPDDRKELIAKNPTLKVPFLVDDEVSVFDSRIIHRYLCEKFELTPLNWKQENILTLIDSVNDTLVSMFLLSKSDFDTTVDTLFFKLQRQRIANVLAALEKDSAQGSFNDWHYPSICLYCLIDWAQFRELVDFSEYPHLVQFWQGNSGRAEVAATDPR